MNTCLAMPTIGKDKQALRGILLNRRNAISIHERAYKAESAAKLALPKLDGCQIVAVYCALASEIDPAYLVNSLRARGKTIVFPRVTPQASIDFCAITDTSQLVPSQFGLQEPCPTLTAIELNSIDAFIVPALSFDLVGNRLGWGKGHYDRTLAQNTDALRVGFCFQEQIEASIPCEPTDQTMDWVVSDSEIYLGPTRHRAKRPENQP